MTELNEQPTYELPSGTVIKLKPVNAMKLRAISNRKEGKPQPPVKEVRRAGKTKMEVDFYDPEYKEKLQEWKDEQNDEVMKFLINRAIDGQVGDYVDDPEYLMELEEETALLFGDYYRQGDIKYTWIITEITEPDELSDFMDAVMAINNITEEGLRESKSSV